MIIQILALVVVIVAAYHVFKTARDNGRSGAGWASLTVGVGLGLQWVLPIILGIVLAVVYMASGTKTTELQTALQTPAMILNLVCLALSFVGMYIILKFVSRIPDEPIATVAPPPPPPFDNVDTPQ